MSTQSTTPWQAVAIASGAFASFNGLFAKLTTAEATTSWAAWLSHFLGQDIHAQYIEYLIRAAVFALSFVFSGIMWGLYTRALSAAPSSIQASIVNTASNFIITAMLGMVVFSEELPPMWWVGAALLVGGTVVIGRREEDQKAEGEKKTQ